MDDDCLNTALVSSSPPQSAKAQHPGNPRDVMWQGGAVHVHMGDGSAARSDVHAHFAVQLTISLDSEISFSVNRRARKQFANGWLIASDQPHLMQGEGAAITMFVDPMSANGQHLIARLAGAGALPLSPPECEAAKRAFHDCLHRGWTADEVRATADQVVGVLTQSVNIRPSLDPRVQKVLAILMLDSTDNVSLGALAKRVRLSESRLAHLFSQEVGIPMRQYRLALRMEHAVAQIARGYSLTESAHMAGFADSAHFCRISRRMFGSAPSALPRFAID